MAIIGDTPIVLHDASVVAYDALSKAFRPTTVGLLALLIGIGAFGFRFLTVRDFTNDHFMQLAYARQLLAGDLPNRDFVDPGMPFTYLLSAAAQAISPGPYSEALLTCALVALAAALTFVATANLTGSAVAGVAAAFMALVLKPHLYSYPKVLAPVVTLVLLHHYLARPSNRRVILLGAWTVVAALFRYDLGIYAVAGIVPALIVAHAREPRVLAGAMLRYAAAALVTVAPYALYVQLASSIPQQFAEAVEFARADEHQLGFRVPEFPVLNGTVSGTGWSYLDSAAVLFYLAHAAVVAALILLALRWRDQPHERRAEVIGLIAILGMYVGFILRHPITSRLLDVSTIGAVAGAWIVTEAGRAAFDKSRTGGFVARWAIGGTAGLALLAAVFSVWNMARVGENLVETRVLDGWEKVQERAAVVRQRGTERPWGAWWPSGRFPEQVIAYVEQCTAPSDRLFVTWPAAEFYFFSQRAFAGGHSWMLPPRAFTGAAHQARTVARLDNARVPVVLINETRREEFRASYNQVDAYLVQHYRPVGQFTIYDGSEITIATRNGLAGASTFDGTAWPCQF